MASVRGILNIQSLIELSSENLFYIRGFRLPTRRPRIDHTSTRVVHWRRSLRMDSHGYIVSRMGFCRAIAMIAKLNERNTFVVSNPARNVCRFASRDVVVDAGARRPGLNSPRRISEPNLVKKCAGERTGTPHTSGNELCVSSHTSASASSHRTRSRRLGLFTPGS
jgi:hypothetical protein